MSTHYGVTIDWLTMTIVGGLAALTDVISSRSEAEQYAEEVARMFQLEDGAAMTPTRPDFGYAFGFAHPGTGIKVHIAWNIGRQGIKVVASGAACRAWGSGLELLRIGYKQGWRATRVDVAWDVLGSAASIGQLHAQVSAAPEFVPKYKTQYISSRSGETLTIGGRSSEKYVRVYDKAAEQGVKGDWIRVEVEVKGDYLRTNLDAIAEDPAVMGHVVLEMFQGAETPLRAPIEQSLTEHKPNQVEGRLAPASGRLRWLEKSVIPTLVKMFREDKSQYDEFVRLLLERID